MGRLFVALLILSLFSTCTFTPGKIGTTSGDEVEVVILQINDVFEIAPLEGGKTGGMARVAYLLNQLREENPNTIAVMAGDFLNPSLLSTLRLDGEKIKGRQMIEVLNAMNFDLVTYGNHEFDLDQDEFQERLNESEFMWVSANIMEISPQGIQPFEILKDGKYEPVPKTLMVDFVDKDGKPFRVGVVAVTLPFNQAGYVHYDDIYKSAKAAYDTLSRDADVIVGLTHLEIEQDKKLAMQLPEIRLIMGGHDHQQMLVQEGPTRITKADANAKTAWVHRLVYNTALDSLVINSELIDIDESLGEDPKVQQVVNKWMTLAERTLDKQGFDPVEFLMYSDEPLEGREVIIRNQPTNLGKLVANAVLDAAFDAEAAIVNSGSIRIDDQIQGEVTQYDVLRMLPFGGAILEVEMKGEVLRQTLQAGIDNQGSGGYLQWANIKHDSRNNFWFIDGLRLVENQYYKIAMPEFLMTGGESNMEFLTSSNPGIKNVIRPKENDDSDTRSDIRKVVIEHMRGL